MKFSLIALCLLGSTVLCSGGTTALVLATFSPSESPVVVTVPAQYLTAEVRIECDEKDWAQKLSGIEQARRSLASAAQSEGFKLRIDRALVFAPVYRKFSFSSSRGGSHEAFSDVLLLSPLSDETDLVDVVSRFRGVLSGLELPKDVSVSLGSIYLALEDPEQYRPELLKRIRNHAEDTAAILLDTPDFVIRGLDEPVRITQSGEREIDVYLPFQVTYQSKD